MSGSGLVTTSFLSVMERNCHLLKGIKLSYHGCLFQGGKTGHVERQSGMVLQSALFCIMFLKNNFFNCC